MHVAMVCPYDLSVPGGAQGQVEGLAAAMQRAGVRVTVVAPVSPPPDPIERDYEIVSVGRSLSVAVNGSRAPVAPGPLAMWRTAAALRRVRPDLVNVHEPLAPGPSLAALLTGPTPLVATFHRAGVDGLYRAAGALLRPAVRRISLGVPVSEAASETARSVLGDGLRMAGVIPNGVDLGLYARKGGADPGGSARRGGPLRVAFVGRHEERKGLGVLLEAIEMLGSATYRGDGTPVFEVLVVGDGPATPLLRRRFGGDTAVTWLGAVDDAGKREVLVSADLFVAPSLRGESFGVILLEAMAAGLPVVASDLPGYRLAAGDAARFVPPGDPRALAAALEDLVRRPVERARLAELSRGHVVAYSMDSVAARYLTLFSTLTPPGVGPGEPSAS